LKERIVEEQALQRLYARRRFGMRPGLETMQALLDRLDHPEQALAVVHVAGTNGKGSVSAMIAEVLSAAGLNVGRYTSPHLLRFNERFFLNGKPVDDGRLTEAAQAVEAAALDVERSGMQPPTFFECATAMAFHLFRKADIRLAVIEVGLGGRLDATNVVTPLVSVITRIGLDHCEQLGNTLEAIAAEKAGIVKMGRPVICGAMPDEARAVIARTAAECRSAFLDVSETVSVASVSTGLDGQVVRVTTPAREIGKVRLPLAGAYQLENLATAMAALETTAEQIGCDLSDEAIRAGLERVGWPARFQLAAKSPPVVVDGAHNPDGAAALREALKRAKWKGPVALVAGFCDDKDSVEFLRTLLPAVKRAWAVPVPSPRSLVAAETAMRMRAAGATDVTAAEFPEALKAARTWAENNNGLVLICGSLFLAGQALAALNAYPWTTDGTLIIADPNEQLRKTL
jgi:dihydrofolate synthase/folylpolyglutamate synthase